MTSESVARATLLAEVDAVIVGAGSVGDDGESAWPERQRVQAGQGMAALTVALPSEFPFDCRVEEPTHADSNRR